MDIGHLLYISAAFLGVGDKKQTKAYIPVKGG